MSITSWAERTIFLRWLRGKVAGWRKQGVSSVIGKILKALDGWKLLIGVLVLFIVKVWDAAHNGHTGDLVGSILTVFGWMPPVQWSGESMTVAVASALALWGFLAKLYKAVKQYRTGATASQLLSTDGAVKLAAARGAIGPILSTPSNTVKVVSIPSRVLDKDVVSSGRTVGGA